MFIFIIIIITVLILIINIKEILYFIQNPFGPKSYYIDGNNKINYIDYNVQYKVIETVKEFIFYVPNRYIKIHFKGKSLKTGESFILNISEIEDVNYLISVIPNISGVPYMVSGELMIYDSRYSNFVFGSE